MYRIILLLLLVVSSNSWANTRDGLVAWWKLDESGNSFDSSWKGGLGTLTGTTFINNCVRLNCHSFNGSSDFIDVSNNSSIQDLALTSGSQSTSWSFWINPVANSSGTILAKNDGNAVSPGWWIEFQTGPQLRLILERSVINSRDSITSPSLNVWSHVVIVSDTHSANPAPIMYVNSVSQAVTKQANGSGTNTSDAAFNLDIGRYSTLAGGGNGFLSGQLDDIRIYNRALTLQEVSDLYNQGIFIRGTATVLKGIKSKFNS